MGQWRADRVVSYRSCALVGQRFTLPTETEADTLTYDSFSCNASIRGRVVAACQPHSWYVLLCACRVLT